MCGDVVIVGGVFFYDGFEYDVEFVECGLEFVLVVLVVVKVVF